MGQLPSNAELVYLGPDSISLSSFGNDKTQKNVGVLEYIAYIADVLYNYRQLIEQPAFSMVDDATAFVQEHRPDLIVTSMGFFGAEALAPLGVPLVGFFHMPLVPTWFETDPDRLCRLPQSEAGVTLRGVQTSFATRVRNQAICHASNSVIGQLNTELAHRGLQPVRNFRDMLFGFAESYVTLGGPPFSLATASMPKRVHLVGAVEGAHHRHASIPAALQQWLDNAEVTFFI